MKLKDNGLTLYMSFTTVQSKLTNKRYQGVELEIAITWNKNNFNYIIAQLLISSKRKTINCLSLTVQSYLPFP